MALDEQVVVPRELDERVVPVEENGLDHGVARVAAWCGGSSGHCSPSTPVALLGRFVFDLGRDHALRPRGARADPARVADRRGDRARRRAHRPRRRRLPERELRQRARADHRAVRGRRRPAGRRARLAHRLGRLEHPARARRRDDRRRRREGRHALAALAARSRCFGAVVAAADPVDPAWDGGSPERHTSTSLSIPVSIVLLCALRRDHRPQPAHPPRGRAREAERAAPGRCEALDRAPRASRRSRPRSSRRSSCTRSTTSGRPSG